jgi:DNA-binding HxlR family transcriptional regulator
MRTEAFKLHRADGPDTSKEAAYKVDTNRWEGIVLSVIKNFGDEGCIQEQVLDVVHQVYGRVSYSTITARFKSLEEKGLIRYEGKRRGSSGRMSRVRVAV